MNTSVVINTQLNAQGEYEGVSIDAGNDGATRDTAEQTRAEKKSTTHQQTQPMQSDDNDRQKAAYYVDINDLDGVSPPWVLQANQLFHQSISANVEGVYSDYMRQVQAQFDEMHQQLQRQMRAYYQASSTKVGE